MKKLILLLLFIPLVFYSQIKNEILESNLPIFVINTENGVSIVDEPKITADLGIIYNEDGKKNYSNDIFNVYDGKIGIEIRGNSTRFFAEKKSYNFETRDDSGENLNVSILGLPSENDWVLRASYFDHTFIRNPLAGYMSRQTGYWAPKTKHVEVMLNGEYQGIYIFIEDIKRDKNRIDINKLKENEISGEDLTGGYIWEVTAFGSNFGERRKLKYPKFSEVHQIQLDYITNFDNAFRNKFRNSSEVYSNPNNGYVEHIWVESFIYELIVQEAMRNSDAYGGSAYYHKDKNGLINAGPVWDFDQSSGNSSYPDHGTGHDPGVLYANKPAEVDGWMVKHPKSIDTPFYWSKLLDDSYFKYSLSLRWKELRADKLKSEKLLTYIDSISTNLSEAQAREFKKWPVLGRNIWRETFGFEKRDTYQKEVDYLKEFLKQRWEWLDLELENISKPNGYPEILITKDEIRKRVDILDEKIELDLNNFFSFPFDSKLKFKIDLKNDNNISIDLKENGLLEMELKNIGFSNVIITAKDTYGNKKSITLNLEVIENSLIIFPNPSSENLNILFNKSTDNTQMNIELYNINGELIDVIYEGVNKREINYNYNFNASGFYILKIKTNKKVYTRKIIINN